LAFTYADTFAKSTSLVNTFAPTDAAPIHAAFETALPVALLSA